jgi:hypothetical protein
MIYTDFISAGRVERVTVYRHMHAVSYRIPTP